MRLLYEGPCACETGSRACPLSACERRCASVPSNDIVSVTCECEGSPYSLQQRSSRHRTSAVLLFLAAPEKRSSLPARCLLRYT